MIEAVEAVGSFGPESNSVLVYCGKAFGKY